MIILLSFMSIFVFHSQIRTTKVWSTVSTSCSHDVHKYHYFYCVAWSFIMNRRLPCTTNINASVSDFNTALFNFRWVFVYLHRDLYFLMHIGCVMVFCSQVLASISLILDGFIDYVLSIPFIEMFFKEFVFYKFHLSFFWLLNSSIQLDAVSKVFFITNSFFLG